MKKLNRTVLSLTLALVFLLGLLPAASFAAEKTYTVNAELKDGAKYPGVYVAAAKPGAKKADGATIGIPIIAKQNLENGPTTQSPAIITGAAVPYEKKVGPTDFEVLPNGKLYAPYSYYRYSIIEEAGLNGDPTPHKKMSGYDGTYVFIRVDVSELIADAPEGSYLHVKQEGNKAHLVAIGMAEGDDIHDGAAGFNDSTGTRALSYPLADGAKALKDQSGDDSATPYVDIILISSGTLIQGADTGGQAAAGTPQADIGLSFYVDQTGDYNPNLEYDPTSQDANHEKNVAAKFYDETKVAASAVTSYTVMGSDLEIEVEVADTVTSNKEYWSLRKAMAYENYNNKAVKLITEVSGLEGIEVKGTGRDARNVILDLNSFDFQIANHQTTGAAALTVDNATLKLQDTSSTTGAELAVGNNAKMVVTNGGLLIVDETCQLEVEYDAASITTQDTTPAPNLSNGVLTVENGGEIEIQGVLTIEGTEGKPIDPAAPAQRDVRNAVLNIADGGIMTIKGCLLINGVLNNRGTINNYGRYDTTIVSNDPDKGRYTYHCGIQLSWKDDVTQNSGGNYSYPGTLYNGLAIDDEGVITEEYPAATINNYGDIVLVPGDLENRGTLNNDDGSRTLDGKPGIIYVAAMDGAVIPITPTAADLTITEKRVEFDQPVPSYLNNVKDGTVNNAGEILSAEVQLVSNGRTGTLTPGANDRHLELLDLLNMGTMVNSGVVAMGSVYNYNELTNSGVIERMLFLSELTDQSISGRFVDSADARISQVYNAVKTAQGSADVWTYAGPPTLTVTPLSQSGNAGNTVKWTVKAEAAGATEDTKYLVEIYQTDLVHQREVMSFPLAANTVTTISSPVLPEVDGSVTYSFAITLPDSEVISVSVAVESNEVTAPSAIPDLVYNGQAQKLVTTGGSKTEGTMVYALGDGQFGAEIPTATDAGTYTVHYKLNGQAQELGSVEAAIAPKPVTISADNLSSKVGAELLAPTWTISGATAEELTGVTITASTNADIAAAGAYDITLTQTGENGNYDITLNKGVYTVTNAPFTVTAKDKYAVYSGVAVSPDVTVDPKDGATVYYSDTTVLDGSNYKTSGVTAYSTGKPGTTVVHYYAADENNTYAISGDTRIVIAKGTPAAPTGITTEAESYLGSGDGKIKGLKPYEMEYRRADNDGTYATAYYDTAFVPAGTYLIRTAADNGYTVSPDTEVTVPAGPGITVSFDSNGGSEVPDATGLAFGDTVPRPANPARSGYDFLGWAWNGENYDFGTPVDGPRTLIARWAEHHSEPEPYDPGGGSSGGTTDKDKDKNQDQKTEPIVFTDVSETDWAYEAIQFVAKKGLFLGAGENTFSPKLPMTRGMFMTVLARMDGQEINGEDWMEKGMAWSVEKGVSDGSDPERPITRQEIVTMLWRMNGSPEPKGDLSARPDGDDADSWAAKAAAWALENGVMNGDENGYLRLREGATREQVAQFLMNYLTK